MTVWIFSSIFSEKSVETGTLAVHFGLIKIHRVVCIIKRVIILLISVIENQVVIVFRLLLVI